MLRTRCALGFAISACTQQRSQTCLPTRTTRVAMSDVFADSRVKDRRKWQRGKANRQRQSSQAVRASVSWLALRAWVGIILNFFFDHPFLEPLLNRSSPRKYFGEQARCRQRGDEMSHAFYPQRLLQTELITDASLVSWYLLSSAVSLNGTYRGSQHRNMVLACGSAFLHWARA